MGLKFVLLGSPWSEEEKEMAELLRKQNRTGTLLYLRIYQEVWKIFQSRIPSGDFQIQRHRATVLTVLPCTWPDEQLSDAPVLSADKRNGK